jgi:hypothetical protein
MRLHMRLKKTLFAMVAAIAVASMVLPPVYASVTITERRRQRISDGSFKERRRDQLIRHNQNPRAEAPNGRQKPLVNNGLLQPTTTKERLVAKGMPFSANFENSKRPVGLDKKGNNRISSGLRSHVENEFGKKPMTLSKKQLDYLNIRQNPVTETAEARTARLNELYKTRANDKVANVLPGAEGVPDDSAFSALGFVGFSGTQDFFNGSYVLGDMDGNRKLERDFDNVAPGLVPRTYVDRSSTVTTNVLLPDEVYTSLAVSGHNAANGFNAPGDFNVFYTGTNAGFIQVEGDRVCDGDLRSDTVLRTFALTSPIIAGSGTVTFSPSASVVGLAIEQDTEWDGDAASDEVLWISVFDPQFGSPANATSALLIGTDENFDDIVDTIQVFSFGFGLVAGAGVAVNSFGDVHWHLTDFVVGLVFTVRDTDEDRIPDDGFYFFNFDGPNATDLDILNAANAVDMAVDRDDRLYLAVSAGDNPASPINTGLPSHIATYTDRCGDFQRISGLLGNFVTPRPDSAADDTFGVFAAQAAISGGQGGGTGTPLVIPELQIDFSGYSGLATDYDDNVYVAIGAAPADASGNQSPFTGSILQIPDLNCDGFGDSVDMNGDNSYGDVDDYRWIDAPNNPATRTPNGIDGIDFGPLLSLNRIGLALTLDDGVGFAFDDLDGEANGVAGGVSDLLFATACDNVGSNTAGGPVGFEFLFCNTAWTGFRMSSKGTIVLTRNDPTPADSDPDVIDFTPTVPEFLAGPPRLAPLWIDLAPGGGGQFSVHRLGFAAVDSFLFQWIDMPEFGRGGLVIFNGGTESQRASVNSFDAMLRDDQDSWDDVSAEFLDNPVSGLPQDDTNCDQTVNDDNDGIAQPVGIGTDSDFDNQIIDRNGDGDTTDDNMAEAAQEGVGRTLPEQGPFQFRYHQIEAVGDATPGINLQAIVGFATGGDAPSFPPSLCETNISDAIPPADAPFMPLQVGMGTEPHIYEFFNQGSYGGFNAQTGAVIPTVFDIDFRETPLECFPSYPTLSFLDTPFVSCVNYKGSNMPVGLFCQSLSIADNSPNDSPFDGPVTFTISGFAFPMPTTGEDAICPAPAPTVISPTRDGKSVTYNVMFQFDEDGDGDIDSMITVNQPGTTAINEHTITTTLDLSDDFTFCGAFSTRVKVRAVFGPGDDNKYFEDHSCNGIGGSNVILQCQSNTNLVGFRPPIVTSIAPDSELCEVTAEDVQVNGLCFFQDITQIFVTTNPDGTGTRVDLTAVTNPNENTANGVINPSALTPNTPYYVFVVRGDGARSTSFPNPLGITVTFMCTEEVAPVGPVIANCHVTRKSDGTYVLQVNADPNNPFTPNNTIVLIDGEPCRRNKYPSRFFQSNGTTTRINCTGGIKRLLQDGAIITTRNADGTPSQNNVACDLDS